MAYALGQILDVNVFNRLRQNRRWYVAPAAAMFVGNLIDTLAFFFIAFWRSTDPFMAANWVEIALVDYSFKVTICMLFFLPAYGVLLNLILRSFLRNALTAPARASLIVHFSDTQRRYPASALSSVSHFPDLPPCSRPVQCVSSHISVTVTVSLIQTEYPH